MGRKKLSIEEMARALTLIEQGVPMNKIAVELNVSRGSLCVLKKKRLLRYLLGLPLHANREVNARERHQLKLTSGW